MNDGFKVVERIDGGEFLDVWTGIHQATNTNVNIQIVDKKKIGNALDNIRFNALCDKVLTLNHPNVLKYFKVVANDKNIAIVTEPIQGRSLRDYLVEKNNKRLAESEARSILRQIVEGVSYLHSNNVVHRYLTLHNIYISNQGEIKLGNLLICTKNADMYKPLTNQKSDCHFFAPEIWDPNTEPDFSCDLWSIGVILYVLVCGCYPFDGKNEIYVFISARHARFMIPNFISAECSSLIRQLLLPAKEARMKLEGVKCHPWYNNLSAVLRHGSQNNFGYSLHSIPESLNENEEDQIKKEEPNELSLSDFAYMQFNIPLDVALQNSVPLIEVTQQIVENPNENNTNSSSKPKKYSHSVPSSPQALTLDEIQAEQSGTKITKVPSRKRSADQEQLLAMMQRGGFSLEDPMIGNLGSTPPQSRKRTSIPENKDILNLLEMPPTDSELNNLTVDLEKLTAEDPNNPNKPRRKKSDPNSPKLSSKKGTSRRTYRRRSLDDFSHLMGPNANPDLPTFSQMFQEPPKESSFAYPPSVPAQQISVPAPTPYSPPIVRNSTSPGFPVMPHSISSVSSMPLSPVIYPSELYMSHQIPHVPSNKTDLPVQPPKITPLVFYSPELAASDPQFGSMQYPFVPGGIYVPHQNSQFDVSSPFAPIPDETLNLPVDTITSKHVSNFVGGVIPETEEEWANNVVTRKYLLFA